ncbi:MAG: hypothetical protein ACYYK0_00915 [Candidatus Eutrophobiaceae bacterium]
MFIIDTYTRRLLRDMGLIGDDDPPYEELRIWLLSRPCAAMRRSSKRYHALIDPAWRAKPIARRGVDCAQCVVVRAEIEILGFGLEDTE